MARTVYLSLRLLRIWDSLANRNNAVVNTQAHVFVGTHASFALV